MTEVYVLLNCPADETEVVGIFSTPEKAIEAIEERLKLYDRDHRADYYVLPYVLDKAL